MVISSERENSLFIRESNRQLAEQSRAREREDYSLFRFWRQTQTRRPRCAGCEAEAAASQARPRHGPRAAAASPSEIGRRTLRLQKSIHQERKEAKHMYILQVAGSHAWSRAEPPQL